MTKKVSNDKLLKSFEESADNEVDTQHELMVVRDFPIVTIPGFFGMPSHEEIEYSPSFERKRIFYISDIHLLHKFHEMNCNSYDDKMKVVRQIAKQIRDNVYGILVIAGDVCSDFAWFKRFFEVLTSCKFETNITKIYFVLGNHELWSFPNASFESITHSYISFFDELNNATKRKQSFNIFGNKYEYEEHLYVNIELLQNDLIYEVRNGFRFETKTLDEITLSSMSVEALRTELKCADFIMYGGLGFAGFNEKFNADAGLYLQNIDRQREIEESIKCANIYKKIVSATSRPVVVITHMPAQDWLNDKLEPEWVYVNGHTHRNYFYDDGMTRVFADNQIGYKSKTVSVKWFDVYRGHDIFADYKDGVHEITKDEYNEFIRAKYVDCGVISKREYANIYLLKKNGYYCFLVRSKNSKGNLQIMNGGVGKTLSFNDVNYYYAYMDQMIKAIREPLSKYDELQQNIAKDIKALGGSGHIHGCIIDIDFWNHIYLNPYDLSVTPYWARSITEKHVYQNVPSLLKECCSSLYEKYEALLNAKSENALVVFNDKNLLLSSEYVEYPDTDIYRASRIIKKMQKTQYHILTIWDDSVLRKAGTLIDAKYEEPVVRKNKSASDYVGQSKKQKGGYIAEIITYRNYKDIDIKFSDGTIIEHTSIDKWKYGYIEHPDYVKPEMSYIGKSNVQKGDYVATILVYRRCDDIDVKFADGVVITHTTMNKWRRGTIKHPDYVEPVKAITMHPTSKERYVGKRLRMNNGKYATCIAYEDCHNLTICWEDGTVREHIRSDHFMNGKVAYVAKSTVKAPIKEAPIKEAPIKEAPIKEAPIKEAPIKDAPIKDAPIKDAPIKDAPIKVSDLKVGECVEHDRFGGGVITHISNGTITVLFDNDIEKILLVPLVFETGVLKLIK